MMTLKSLSDAYENYFICEYMAIGSDAVGGIFSMDGKEYKITEDLITPKGIRLIGLKDFYGKPVVHKNAVFYGDCFILTHYEIRQKAGFLEYPGTKQSEGFFPGTVVQTRDGRRIGNAVIYDRDGLNGTFDILTDFGNCLRMGSPDVSTYFYPPTRRISCSFLRKRCEAAGIETTALDY